MNRIVRACTLTAAGLTLAACTMRRVEPPSPARSEWTTTLPQVTLEAQASRYAAADRLLSDFAARHPGSAEAAETIYWRALYRLDPANPASSPHEAVALFDSYLGSPAAGAHRAEATALRRLASAVETRLASAGTSAAPAQAQPAAADKARDEELQRLRDELAKANAELERIRRRLAQPKP